MNENKKQLQLLRIAGFNPCRGFGNGGWVGPSPDDLFEHDPPNLYDSADAQAKWLFPKVRKDYWVTLRDLGARGDNIWGCELNGSVDEKYTYANGNTLANAFAEAVLEAYKREPQ